MQFWGSIWEDTVKIEIFIGDSWLKRLKGWSAIPNHILVSVS
jgi:hypothetical protein